jgi:YggT family protein
MFNLSIAHFIINYGIGLVILAMIIRAIASWFRIDERYAFIRILARICDPFIIPVRRIVPPMGFFDMAFLITIFMLWTLRILLLQGLPPTW